MDGSIAAHHVRIGDYSSFRQGHNFYGPVTVSKSDRIGKRVVNNICEVPDLLSACFTGRYDELDQIKHALDRSSGSRPARCVIYGMPGAGKTQLALKYAESALKERQYPFVFWISGASIDKLNSGFSKLFDLVDADGRTGLDQTTKCVAARIWLEDSQSQAKKEWLLVIDNANQETEEYTREMLPRNNSSGKILLTTRTKNTAKSLAIAFGEQHPCIALDAPSLEDAVKMFLGAAGIEREDLDASSLRKAEGIVKAVGRLPLAVDQAASFAKESGYGISGTLDIYTSEHIEEVLEWENDLSRYEEKSVMATFTITLDQLQKASPETSDLLRILAFLDPEGVPVHILEVGVWSGSEEENGVNGAKSSTDDLGLVKKLLGSKVELQKTIQYLQRLSLLVQQQDRETTTPWLHDLTQLILRTKLMGEPERKKWLRLTIHIICGAFKRIEDPKSPKCWTQCDRFVAHVQALQRHAERYQIDGTQLMKTGFSVAWYLYARGRYREAEAMNRRILEIREKVLGLEHPDTLSSVNDIGVILRRQGKYEKAEAMHRRALEVKERVLGLEHPDTLCSVNDLGSTLWRQGKYEEAEAIHQRVLKVREKILGSEHPDTLFSVNNLGLALLAQGKYEKAEAMHRRALEVKERVLGLEHPDTLCSVSNLGLVLRRQGKYEEAEAMHQRALETREKVLGSEHPDTLCSVSNLGLVLRRQGEEAEALHQRALKVREKVLGSEHPDTLFSVNNLGLVFWVQGKYEEAEAMYQRALEVKERVLGSEHPDTRDSFTVLKWVLESQGKYEEAESLRQQKSM